MESMLEIKLIKSPFGRLPRHKRTLQALGLRKIGSKVLRRDLPHFRGMVNKVGYLLSVKTIQVE